MWYHGLWWVSCSRCVGRYCYVGVKTGFFIFGVNGAARGICGISFALDSTDIYDYQFLLRE